MTQPQAQRIPDTVPELDLGGAGPTLVFLHANGYPPQCYRPLLDAFAGEFHVRAMFMRPLWRASTSASIHSWHKLTCDFLEWLDRQEHEAVVAVGHSMGAIVALRAALQEPDRFSALVLLDPVLVASRHILIWRLARHLGLGHRLHSVIRRAEKRRTVFRDVNEAFQAYRPHAVFWRLGDHQLKVVIRGMLQPVGDHLELHYAPVWEARMYFTAAWKDGDLWKGLPTLAVPTLMIRGAESDTFTEEACAAARAANRHVQVQTVDHATHLVPLERPIEVHNLAHDFLRHSIGWMTSSSGNVEPRQPLTELK